MGKRLGTRRSRSDRGTTKRGVLMFDRACIRAVPSRRERRVNLFFSTFAAALLLRIGSRPAGAVPPADGGGGGGSEKRGGVVMNHTDMTMRIAVLTGSWRCRVYMWPSSFRPDDRNCQWKRLPPGAGGPAGCAAGGAVRVG